MSEPIKWTNVTLKLSQLKKWENNPAEISKEAAGRLVECFNEFGQIETLAVDPENRLVDGHQRLDTWLAKYGDIEVDCRKASRLLTEKERQKIAVMLRSGAVGRYNWDVVSSWSADDLQGWGMDSATLKEWKHDVSALDNFIESEKKEPVDAEPQIDRAAELNEKWQVKTGDLWQIGEHRLLCGDSTVKADVDRVMGGEKADMVFTDPPYGVGRDIENDDLVGKEFDTFNAGWLAVIPSGINCGMVCYHSTRTFPSVLDEAVNAGWKFERMLWYYRPDKFPTNSWKHWMMVSQAIMLFSIGDVEYADTESDQDCYRLTSSGLGDGHSHPTEKMAEHSQRVMSHFGASIVYEPFCGSGTTMVACENLHRKCRAIEISPNYCAVILERMSVAFPELEIIRL